MSRAHDGQRTSFPFGNPFRMIRPKGSYVSPQLLTLLNSFEVSLAESLKKLEVKDKSNVLSLSWMKLAMESVCETHTSIKTLITDLQFPVSEWDEKWVHLYLDNSVKLLDMCIAFSSELSRLNQGQLLLQYALHVLDGSGKLPSSEQLVRAQSSLQEWRQQISLKSQKLENCTTVLHGLVGSLYLAKVKNSAKGKVLMRAMYGVMVKTIFVCSIFAAAFSGSVKPLMDLHVPDIFLWSEAFNNLQEKVNGEVRRLSTNGTPMTLKELEAVHGHVQKVYTMADGEDHKDTVMLRQSISGLSASIEGLSEGLDLLSKKVDGFFQIVLAGRDALIGNLRVSDLKQTSNV